MIIKKFEAATEPEAFAKVKAEMGANAVVLTIKRIKPRGFFSFLKKPKVEVTAAYDDNYDKDSDKLPKTSETKVTKNSQRPPKNRDKNSKRNSNRQGRKSGNSNVVKNNDSSVPSAQKKLPEQKKQTDDKYDHESVVKDFKIQEQQIKIKNLESKLSNTEEMLSKFSVKLSSEKFDSPLVNSGVAASPVGYRNPVVQVFYSALIKHGVTGELTAAILDGLDSFNDFDKSNINMLVKIVYNRIVAILGEPEPIVINNSGFGGKVVIFMGPTGVGKTSTIAKLSSHFILSKHLKVGLITADTYRIAAIEQLRTYADILGTGVSVVYNPDELTGVINELSAVNDIVFIDTAGRSHKNSENIRELEEILSSVPNAQKFLVLSLTTKFDDLVNIIDVYSDITDYRLIFTKIDETSSLGAILNISNLTGKPLSYITNGQDVPDDIKLAQPELIARTLLGSADV